MNHEVLVLNNDYEPLNVCNLRRAIVLVCMGKADVLHNDHHLVGMVSGAFDSPSVVKLRHYVNRPIPELKLSRRSVFARDNFTCQYCGATGREMTVDHVVPRRHGGPSTWENLVCCCRKCNNKKGDKSLEKSGMVLARQPRRPKYVPFISLTKYLSGARNDVWRDYLPFFGDFPVTPRQLD
ncbi:MAG TPA: HNH endonuclease [Armatimonadota bacterium]|jgi:5-methylcytosine-specific restriction endonuclease McrA